IAAAVGLLATPSALSQPADLGVAPVELEGPYIFDTAEQHGIRVDVLVRGLDHPFSLAFLPSGDALVSERGGALRLVRGATGSAPQLMPEAVAGAPPASSARGAGLHEVAVHPDFERNGYVYLTYNEAAPPPSGAAGGAPVALKLLRARFDGE